MNDVQNKIWKHSPTCSNPSSHAQPEFRHKMFICYVSGKVLGR